MTHCCSPMVLCAVGCIPQAKLPYLNTYQPLGSPSVAILLASSVWTLVHCLAKYRKSPDLKSSSDVNLTFACIIGPTTDPNCFVKVKNDFSRILLPNFMTFYTVCIQEGFIINSKLSWGAYEGGQSCDGPW